MGVGPITFIILSTKRPEIRLTKRLVYETSDTLSIHVCVMIRGTGSLVPISLQWQCRGIDSAQQ